MDNYTVGSDEHLLALLNQGDEHAFTEVYNRYRQRLDRLHLKPTVLSMLIRINDFWHCLTNYYKGTVQTYLTDVGSQAQGNEN